MSESVERKPLIGPPIAGRTGCTLRIPIEDGDFRWILIHCPSIEFAHKVLQGAEHDVVLPENQKGRVTDDGKASTDSVDG